MTGDRTVMEPRVAAPRHAIPTQSTGAAQFARTHPIALVTLAGAVLRLAVIARQPIGYDEDFTAVTVHQPLDRMLDIVSHDSAPPLFYLLERAVVAVFDGLGMAGLGGPGGPVALRLVPAVSGIALIPLLAALARRMAGDRAALWTALFVAFCPATVLFSGFARMYGLGATLTVAATLLLWRAVDGRTEQPTDRRPPTREDAWPWVAYLVCAAAAAWTDYFCVVALIGIAVAAVWLRPTLQTALLVVTATGLAIATLIPWLVFASAQFQRTGQSFWVPPLSLQLILGTLGQLFAGAVSIASPPGISTVVWLLQWATIAVWLVALGRLALPWRRLGPNVRRGVVFGLLASSGIFVLVVVSVWRPILDARYASLMWMPVFGLAGLGLSLLPRQVAGAAVVIVAAASLSVTVPVNHPQVRDLIPELNSQVGPHDLVATTYNRYLVLLDESDSNVRDRLHLLRSDDPNWYDGTAAYPEGAVVHEVPADVIADGGRIFWVAPPGVTTPLIPPGYQVTESRCVPQACLTVYTPPG